MAQLGYVGSFIREVYQHAESTESPSLGGPWFSRKGQGSIFFDESDAVSYSKVVARLVEDYGAAGDISRKTLATLVQDALFATLDLQATTQDAAACEKRLKTAVRELHRKLTEAPAAYSCYVPVQGLSAEGLPMTVGRARLLVMSAPRLRRLVLPSQLSLPADGKNQRRQLMGVLAEDDLPGQRVALVSVLARDPEAAETLARRDTRVVVDVLNFFVDLVPNSPGWLYLAGEAGSEATSTLVAHADGSLTVNRAWQGPISEFSTKRLQSVPKLSRALGRIHELIKEEPRSALSELLLTAIRWAGRASVEPIPEHAFVQYVIAMEALLLPTESQGIKHRLQTRVSHLLAGTARDRQWYFDTVKKLYEVRSDIAHDGSFEVDPGDLATLRMIVKSSIFRVLMYRGIRRLGSLQEFARWLDTR